MEVIHGLYSTLKRYRKPVVTIGIFDGVHLAHQHIINKVIKTARDIRGTSFLITFYPHPLKILSPKIAPPLLISLKQRLIFFSQLGVDAVLCLNFGLKLSKLKAEDFVKRILVDKIRVHSLIVGEDFLFGYRHRGDVHLLKEMGDKFGFDVYVLPEFKVNGIAVSSTLVRQAIASGELKFAARLLGRTVSIYGTVMKGTSCGRIIGYPTANIDYQQRLLPPNGVYCVKVSVKDTHLPGILYIGRRPTFGSFSQPVAEVHIIDFKQNLYGKTIEAVILKKIRDEKKFLSPESLARQIKKDEQIARSLYLVNHNT